MKKFSFLFLLSLFAFQSLQAFHLIGTELTYQYLGDNNYKFILKVYRDCSNVQGAPFDDPLFLAVYRADSTLLQDYSIPLQTVTSIVQLECSSFPFGTCLQSAEYDITVNLLPVLGGYLAAYQRCCRNNILTNIDPPDNTGLTAWIEITDSALAHGNSTPQILNYPATDICLDQLYTFNYNVYTLFGDSLSFHLTNPYAGASASSPQPNPSPPPPYPLVNYAAPYTYLQPLGPASPISLDALTGLLQVTPTTIGCYLVGVQIDQYRNEILLSTIRSDFEFTVTEYNVGADDPNNTSAIQIYNDADDDLLIIQNSTQQKLSVNLFDELGREHLHQSSSENKFQFSTSSLAAGIYFVEFADENGMSLLSKKIFKK